MFNVFVFALLYLFIVNWFQVISFSRLIIGPKIKTSSLKDKWIFNTVRNKAGLNLLDITLFHDSKMYGMMAGLPFWPKMILSTGLYKSFNKDELEWVILHEAGHCVLWHNLQSILIEMIILVFGSYLIVTNSMNIFVMPILAMLFAILCIQIIRWTTEYTADTYSINRVNNPKGVITAQDKFRKNYRHRLLNDEGSLLRQLFHWNISPSQRVQMARKRLFHINLLASNQVSTPL